ncbi:hypothetical protein [Desulfoplanes sp.]
MDVPLAMYRDEIETYKEAMCCEFAAECGDEEKILPAHGHRNAENK